MGIAMMGLEVAKAMKEDLIQEVQILKEKGICPHLTIIRVGARPDDLAYERGARKRMELVGIDCNVIELEETVSQETFETVFQQVNQDEKVHGILLFQPLPAHLDAESVKAKVHPYKDVDCMCKENAAKIFMGDQTGHAPCTAEAVMEMLHHYEISVAGKHVVILGRSLVIGKPLSMLMLEQNATVTICHSRTENLEVICKEADILVAAVGRAHMVTEEMVREGAVVVDVGINVDENGNLCGDVDYERVAKTASYISPVPKGVGSVTTSVLAKHVISAAKLLDNNC